MRRQEKIVILLHKNALIGLGFSVLRMVDTNATTSSHTKGLISNNNTPMTNYCQWERSSL